LLFSLLGCSQWRIVSFDTSAVFTLSGQCDLTLVLVERLQCVLISDSITALTMVTIPESHDITG
jgi:hypothetical protein